MKEPIFKVSDLELCSIPLPAGYPLSWTHPSIEYSQNGIGGYNYFLGQTPYPSGADVYENPMIYRANARVDNKPPINWIAFPNNPLQEDPQSTLGGIGYNADIDLIIDNGVLYSTCRPYLTRYNLNGAPIQRTWVNSQAINSQFTEATEPIDLYDNYSNNYWGYGNTLPTLVSPAFIRVGDKIRSYHLITTSYNADKTRMRQLVIMEGTDMITPNNFTFKKFGSVLGRDLEPWHIDVFKYQNKYYAIVVCTDMTRTPTSGYGAQMLAVSEDGENFRIYPRPLTTASSYRGTAFVREDGLFCMYTSTVAKIIPQQTSIDGRDIFLASMEFENLLELLQ